MKLMTIVNNVARYIHVKYVLGGVIFISAGFAWAMCAPETYRSIATLAPAKSFSYTAPDSGELFLSGALRKPVQSLVARPVITEALKTLESHKFLCQFIIRRGLLSDVLTASKWDIKTDPTRYDESINNVISDSKLNLNLHDNCYSSKLLLRATKALRRKIVVLENKQTRMVSIYVDHSSLLLSRNILIWLIEDIQIYMQDKELKIIEASMSKLSEKIQERKQFAEKAFLSQLSQQIIAKKVLFEGNFDYPLSIIDPPVAAEVSARFARVVVIFGSLFAVLILIRLALRSRSRVI